MSRWKVNLCPGPTSCPPSVLAAFGQDYGSADLEDEFFDTYARCCSKIQTLLNTKVIATVIPRRVLSLCLVKEWLLFGVD